MTLNNLKGVSIDAWFGPAGKRGVILSFVLMLVFAIAYQAQQLNAREKQIEQLNRALVACEADKVQIERTHQQDKIDLVLLMTDFESLQKEVDGVKQRIRKASRGGVRKKE